MTTEPLASIAELTCYRLANLADVGSADFDHDGAGARFLTSVRDNVIEALTYDTDDPIGRAREWVNDADGIHEIADNAPDVYNSTRWQEFTDLAAWQEDITELGVDPPEDLTAAAGVALYIIAERLAVALVVMVADSEDDDS